MPSAWLVRRQNAYPEGILTYANQPLIRIRKDVNPEGAQHGCNCFTCNSPWRRMVNNPLLPRLLWYLQSYASKLQAADFEVSVVQALSSQSGKIFPCTSW